MLSLGRGARGFHIEKGEIMFIDSDWPDLEGEFDWEDRPGEWIPEDDEREEEENEEEEYPEHV
jgi:hypothetical protein